MTSPAIREARGVRGRAATRNAGRSERHWPGAAGAHGPAAEDASRAAQAGRDFEVNFISLRHSHHAQGSGYDRLLDYLPGRVTGPIQPRRLWQRALTRALRPALRHSGSTWYHRESLLAELAVARHWFRARRQLFHFLYGENLFRYLGLLKRSGRRHPIVATYHTPRERFAELVRDTAHLQSLDALVVLTRSARRPFVDLLGEDRVHFVPHGVDVDRFRPADAARPLRAGELNCLCVGSHLRDFDTLARAARQLHEEDARVRITVVTRPEHHAAFAGLPNVAVLERVDDAALVRAYQHTDAFLLPLRAATANNALLEALACGAPVVASRVEGISDYLSDACALRFEAGDPRGLVEALKALRDAPELRRRLARASRERALEFRWEAVAGQMQSLYAELVRANEGTHER